MELPHGLTEKELVDTLDKVLKNLAGKFRFGYHDIEDIKQQGKLEFLEKGLAGWDGKRALDSFAYIHIRNRLINFKRNKSVRLEPPCTACPFFDPKCKLSTNKCAEFKDKMDCARWAGWIARNDAKKNINSPIDINDVDDEHEDRMRMTSDAGLLFDKKEILEYLDQNVPLNMRADYLRLTQGVNVPKQRREVLMQVIADLVKDKYGEIEEED